MIVIGHAGPNEVSTIASGHGNRPIIDLYGVNAPEIVDSPVYNGICW
jgi:hypothetical protein